jgi:hypothetical protein
MTQAYPLQWPEGWPRTPEVKRAGGMQFRMRADDSAFHTKPVTFGDARDKLYEEVRKLGGKNIVLSSNNPVGRNGIPIEASRRLDDPGFALYFSLGGRPMVMACDRFQLPAANLASLRLAIEALRQLERHGGGYMMERAFAGFSALPPPASEEPPLDWRAELGPLPDGLSPGDLLAIVESRYRAKAKSAHSDHHGGDDSRMIRLNAAIAGARTELGA